MGTALTNFTIAPDSPADFVRYAVALLGIFLTGANIAFIVEARLLFPSDAVRFWRVFFGGKALSSLILSNILFYRHGEVSWRTIGATASFLLVLYALGMIWLRRPYKFVVVRPELLADEEREQIIETLEAARCPDIQGHRHKLGGAGTERTS